MTNKLCMAVNRINNNDMEYNRALGSENTHLLYEAMSEIVIHSAKTFIQEDFDVVKFTKQVNSYQEIFHNNFQNVYTEWKENGPNNILFLDCDTLVVNPVSVFGQYQHFQMFNYTDPKRLSGKDRNNKYGLDFAHYFNAGCRYYPAEMSQNVWDLGWSYANDWDYDIWGTEQLIFNAMMYSADPDVKRWLDPSMNYQAMNLRAADFNTSAMLQALNNWNQCDFDQAKILHLHGTRGAKNTLMLQWNIWRNRTGEKFQFKKLDIVTDSSNNPLDVIKRG